MIKTSHTLSELWELCQPERNKMLMRGSYYAGRGPTTTDLNDNHLNSFFEGLEKYVGKEAAANFVRFVNQLEDLSASAFIAAFEDFYYSGFQPHIKQEPVDALGVRGYNNLGEKEAIQFGLMEMMFGGGSRVDTKRASQGIKGDFIRRHSDLIPETERKQNREWNSFGYTKD